MGGYGLFGRKAVKPPPELLETGLSWLQRIDAVQCKLAIKKTRTLTADDVMIDGC